MKNYNLTKVWDVDGKLVVADTIEKAIALYKDYCRFGSEFNKVDPTIESITAVGSGSLIRNYDAIIRNTENHENND